MNTKRKAEVGAIHFGDSDSVIKKPVSSLKTNLTANADQNQRRCLRHQVQPAIAFCGLCNAYKTADGDFEKARCLFIKGETKEHSFENTLQSTDLVIEYAEIG